MAHIRDFSARERPAPLRNVEDAPQSMRQELIDLFFTLIEDLPQPTPLRSDRLYDVISQTLGVQPSGNPYRGFRHASGRDINRVEWPSVYDLISRLWNEYDRAGLAARFLEGVDRILAVHGSAWELHGDGRLHRVLPLPARQQVEAVIAELQDARYAGTLALLTSAIDAYDARPRRDRDACANAFDAVESSAKTRYAMPNDTLGAVLAHMRRVAAVNQHMLGVLEAVNTLRNRVFGHGMTVPFTLTQAEVDFTYLTCIGAVVLIVRQP